MTILATARRASSLKRYSLNIMTLSIMAIALALTTSKAARADFEPFWDQPDLKAKAAKTAQAQKAKTRVAQHHGKKLGGHAEASEPPRRKRGVRVAALGNSYYPDSTPPKSLSGGGVRWTASSGCLDSGLRSIINQVAASFGPVTVNSTCRSRGHNAAVGGARRSKHLSGDAVDFRVSGNVSGVYAYLKSNGGVGGLKHYGGGLFHIDNGERRSW